MCRGHWQPSLPQHHKQCPCFLHSTPRNHRNLSAQCNKTTSLHLYQPLLTRLPNSAHSKPFCLPLWEPVPDQLVNIIHSFAVQIHTFLQQIPFLFSWPHAIHSLPTSIRDSCLQPYRWPLLLQNLPRSPHFCSPHTHSRTRTAQTHWS